MASGYELGFRSLDRELRDRRLPLAGELPKWLGGALIRNGPAKFEVGGERVAHWFDGLAMLHRFGFDGEGVTYTNRFLRTETYREATEKGRLPAQFASGGASGYLRRLYELVVREPTDNANVHVAKLANRHVALTEVPRYVAFDPGTLETVGEVFFGDDLTGHLNCAHVVPDPHRGETVGLLTRFGRPSEYRVYRLPEGDRTRRAVGTVEVADPAYLHSFALTGEHVVLTEHPYTVDPKRFLLPGGDSFVDHYEWHPNRGTRFLVLDRETGASVATLSTESFFVFHHVNAFAREGEIVVDLVAYPDDEVVGGLYLDDWDEWLRDGSRGELRRYRLPLGAGHVDSKRLYEGVEMPRIAPADRTRPYRYVYGQGAAEPGGNHVVKVDVETGDTWRWEEPGVFVEEPVFVRAPGAETSDQGVVLVTALDTEAERSILLVLDGETLEERARAPIPHPIPFGFHGRYFPRARDRQSRNQTGSPNA